MKAARAIDRLAYERVLWQQGVTAIAGVDEAGRGPLAGPVVAAAVVLPLSWAEHWPAELEGLNDSKQLTVLQREHFFATLTTHPLVQFALGEVDAEMVDQINILRATHRAMRQALGRLPTGPQHVLVDGTKVPFFRWPQTPIIKGDALSYSIAAASVIAKVTRDRLMNAFHLSWPRYGFAEHKGYSTPQHLAALRQHGPCPIHRRSFAPLQPVPLELFTEAARPAMTQ